MKVEAEKIIEDDIVISRGGPVICSNGMGKDGISIGNLAKEVGRESRGFIVGNQYKSKSLWNERISTVKDFYKYIGTDYDLVMTDYLQRTDYKIIPWWMFSLPLAYVRGSDAMLCGLNLGNTKVFSKNFTPYRTNISIFSLEYISEVLGMSVNNPFFSLSFYGIQKFLIDRYPETVKFQRTCMVGNPNCGKCFECNALAMHFRSMGYDPIKLGYNTNGEKATSFKLSSMFKDTVENAYKKLKNQPYEKWLDNANHHALDFNWNKDSVNKILLEHFDVYDKDPGDDGMGTCNYPSLWREWTTKKRDLFWNGNLKG